MNDDKMLEFVLKIFFCEKFVVMNIRIVFCYWKTHVCDATDPLVLA